MDAAAHVTSSFPGSVSKRTVMGYNSDFERAFIERSLVLVQQYNGPYDATILLNCLLGLLVVPKEACLLSIPRDPIENLSKWGINPSAIISFGTSTLEDKNPHHLRGLVWHLRNAVAHFHFRPIPEAGEVEAFHFQDGSGFQANISLSELRNFVERLANHLFTA